ncbi:SdpI family protein [Mucilaginibacter polytrichastri]|uniref:SdpI/YhfL protein family n=1 Tax=Mucilaginibacter polytrichastri TaxID=1302689 RepID=A0A1Q6A5V9_9SPHI|nr:SdpI family protein [Mucilaginibacter polytrichastri]OKS89394.1 hypothetical protein RG47T_4878 [Mucilaginibacter polytrichastri]SFS73312.1 SdpI/YhfL protein family protein [Mucilaginibacter polytrichastri]
MINWVSGPQFIGVIMLLNGLIQRTFPPKYINGWYGYRTNTSMQNQQTWDEGNIYSTKLWVKIGFLFVLIGMALSLVLHLLGTTEKLMNMIQAFSTLAAGLAMAIIMHYFTEKHLKKMFGTKQNL